MYKQLCKTKGERNEDQVYLIKKVLNRMEKAMEKEQKDNEYC